MLFGTGLWHALGATALISALPNLLLIFAPQSAGLKMGSGAMLAFAAGGMLGDVFLHSVPHLLEEEHHDHDHDHDHGHGHVHGNEHRGHDHERHLFVGLLVLLGYLLFYAAERLAGMRLAGKHSHAHQHEGSEEERPQRSKSRSRKSTGGSSNNSSSNNSGLFHIMLTRMAPAGWLNLVADSMHNFTDGIAIGASFSSGAGLAKVKVLSVLLHEVPHEIGDFTILVHSGLSKWQAIQAQFVTAIAAFAGTLVGLAFSNMNKTAQDVLLCTTTGGFLYVSTAIVASISSSSSSGKHTVTSLAFECLGFALGAAIMVAVAFLEDSD